MGFDPFSSVTEGAVKGFLSSVSDIVKDFKADPTKVAELETQIQQAALSFQATAIQSINQTMQAEGQSNDWIYRDWRPVVGWVYSLMLLNNYILMPYFQKMWGLQPIILPTEVIYSMMALLGVSTMTTGVEKVFRSIGK